MTTLLNDIKYATRQLRKSPGSTVIAVVTLTLGIGAGTAVFSLVNAVLLRSLPLPNPQALRVVQWTGTEARMRSISGHYVTDGPRHQADSVSAPMFFALREQGRDQADIFGFAPLDDVATRTPRATFAASGLVVSDNFFSGLKVSPFLGQLFVPGQTEIAQKVVITHAWWQTRFNENPEILGQTVTLDGQEFSILGVLPQGFPGIRPNEPRAFYVPMTADSPFLDDPLDSTHHWWVRMMARLQGDTNEAQLKAQLDVTFAREGAELMTKPKILLQPGRCGLALDQETYRKPLLLMLAIVGLLMLVVCANLAGLSLARSAARRHELSIRAALGAVRGRLMCLAFIESLVLSLFGGGCGILLALWMKTALAQLISGSLGGLHYDLGLDLRVLGFSLAMALVTGLLSGLLPALRAGRANPVEGLKERGPMGKQRLRTGRLLVAAQVCLSLLLLFCAGLYVRSFNNLTHISPGFDTQRLLLFDLSPRGNGYEKDDEFTALYDQVQEALLATPGVTNVTVASFHLFDKMYSSGSFRFAHEPAGMDTRNTNRLCVSETFFDTLGVPMLQGRVFNKSDGHAVVVNESFVQTHMPGQNPIGQTIHIWNADWQILGICRNARYRNIKEAVEPTTYFHFRERTMRWGAGVSVRTTLPPLALADTVRQVVARIAPNVPVANVTTQESLRNGNISQERFLVMLCGSLAGLALSLSCIGLYGLMACHVEGRTPEIAIRKAVGACPGDIARPILREALMLTCLGIGTALPLVWVASRVIRSQLYDVPANDPMTLIAVTALLIAVALLAAWIPARRAARIDPMEALRYE